MAQPMVQPVVLAGRRRRRKFSRTAFGERLHAMRCRRNLSATTLSELCGVSKNMVGRYERGEKVPSVNVLVALADFLGVTVDELIGWDG